jgi:hypothetical protein
MCRDLGRAGTATGNCSTFSRASMQVNRCAGLSGGSRSAPLRRLIEISLAVDPLAHVYVESRDD